MARILCSFTGQFHRAVSPGSFTGM